MFPKMFVNGNEALKYLLSFTVDEYTAFFLIKVLWVRTTTCMARFLFLTNLTNIEHIYITLRKIKSVSPS